jgi:hypothetical protein
MVANVVFGFNDKRTANAGTGYASLNSVILTEEQTAGSPAGTGVGMGQRLSPHMFKSGGPSTIFTSGSVELAYFNGGRQVFIDWSGYASVSDATIIAMFTRMLTLDFGGVDTSGAGTKKPLEVWFSRNHEFDRPGFPSPSTFLLDWNHLRALRDSTAASLGVDKNRVKFVWVSTGEGYTVGRNAPFYPGNAAVDYLGADIYNFGPATQSWVKFQNTAAHVLTFAASHGAKQIIVGETQTVDDPNYPTRAVTDGHTTSGTKIVTSTQAAFKASDKGGTITGAGMPATNIIVSVDSATQVTMLLNSTATATTAGLTIRPSRAAQWWQDLAVYVNANAAAFKAIYGWQGDPGWGGDMDATRFPVKHEAIRQAIAAVGGYAGYGTGSGGVLAPNAPTGLALSATSDGTGLVATWAAPAGSDPVPTAYYVFLATGNVTTGFVKRTITPLPTSPRTYTITGLQQGTTYTVTMTASNAGGTSGFGDMVPAVTAVPGSNNQAPVITAGLALPDPNDPSTINFTGTAFDPEGNPLTYTWIIDGPLGFEVILTGATVSNTFANPGAYTAVLSVSDGTDTTPLNLQFAVSDTSGSTTNFHWPSFPPGMDLRQIPVLLRQILPDIDDKVYQSRITKSAHNAMHGLVASSFDPIDAASTTGGKTGPAAGELRWYKMVLQDFVITGISTRIVDAQVGTGSEFCIWDASGTPLCGIQSGAAVDAALVAGADYKVDLDVPVSGLVPSSIVYVSLFCTSAATTLPTLRTSAALGVMSATNLPVGYQRGNVATGLSGTPDSLPFGSAAAAVIAYVGLY